MLRPFLALLIAAAASASAARAALQWETTHVTINAAPGDDEAVGVFRFTNRGAETVHITDTRTSCGCTVPALAKSEYAPGETGELRAVFRFDGRVGHQVKTISVQTDAPDAAPDSLTLEVEIPRLFDFDRSFVVWRRGEEPTPKTITVHVLVPEVLRLVSVESKDNRFAASLEADPAQPAVYRVTITPANTTDVAQSPLIVTSDFPAGNPRVLTIYALVR